MPVVDQDLPPSVQVGPSRRGPTCTPGAVPPSPRPPPGRPRPRGAPPPPPAGATLDLQGRITDEAGAGITAQAGSTVINDADVTAIGPLIDLKGALTGTGDIDLGGASTLDIEGSAASGQTITFGGVDGRLQVAQPTAFSAAIAGFSPGDLIDLTSVEATAATYAAGSRSLTLLDASGAVVATLHDVQAAPGALVATSDGSSGGTTIGYAGALPRRKYQIADADSAVRGDVARDTLVVPSTGAAVTGAGIKVGIISNSFDTVAPGSANADAAAGYLPANPDGTSAVTVLSDSSGGDDEGRAMAEEVHQIAPGAQLYFAAQGSTQASFAASVQALAQAGCNVIVDDVTFTHGPFYQVDGSVADAEAAAVAQGIDVFTSAGNYGQAYLEQPFTPQTETLSSGMSAQAQVFDNGTPYETVTIPSDTTTHVDLEWTAPFEGLGNAGAPDALGLEVFDSTGKVVGQGTVETVGGVPSADVDFDFPVLNTSADYQLAITLDGGQISPSAYKLILSAGGTTGGTGPGGIIHDPAAGQGSGDERAQQIVPGVNTVGESYFGNSAAFGLTPSYNTYSSDQGPGTLLYDGVGDPLPSPVSAGKVDFDAPTGIYTTVPGFAPFFGTSAAAPNAAAVAALMLQADPSLTPAQVTAFLAQSAVDQGLPPGQQGAGLIQADGAVSLAISALSASDQVSLSPAVVFDGRGTFTLTGDVSSLAGVQSVDISALVDGTDTDLGTATVNADGTFDFSDLVGAHTQGSITATETDKAGGTAAGTANYSLTGGLPFGGAEQDIHNADGSAVLLSSRFAASGQPFTDVQAPDQTVGLQPYGLVSNHRQGDTTFVFSPGSGIDVIGGLKVGGADHDTIDLPSSDFQNFADVLRNTGDVNGSAFITDPKTGDAIRLVGVTTAELKQHPKDFAFVA